MIARYWSGRIRAGDTDAYAEYVRGTGVATQRATEGNRGSLVLVRTEGEEAEVVVISLWDSFEAIRRFAGPDPEVAVFYPEDERYLVSADLRVQHYAVPAIALPT